MTDQLYDALYGYIGAVADLEVLGSELLRRVTRTPDNQHPVSDALRGLTDPLRDATHACRVLHRTLSTKVPPE